MEDQHLENNLNLLSNEILLMIFSFLDSVDLLNLSLTSRRVRELCQVTSLWSDKVVSLDLERKEDIVLALRTLQFAPQLRALNLRNDHLAEEPLVNLTIPLSKSKCQVKILSICNDSFDGVWLDFFEKQTMVKYLSLDYDFDWMCDGRHSKMRNILRSLRNAPLQLVSYQPEAVCQHKFLDQFLLDHKETIKRLDINADHLHSFKVIRELHQLQELRICSNALFAFEDVLTEPLEKIIVTLTPGLGGQQIIALSQEGIRVQKLELSGCLCPGRGNCRLPAYRLILERNPTVQITDDVISIVNNYCDMCS